jgi:putative toxin-antitoxin system antitoxin component (TIGR02293 family)
MKAAAAHQRTVVRKHVYAGTLSPQETAAHIKRGLPVKEFDALKELLGMTVEALARKVRISIATLSRRRQRGGGLDVDHGDRVMRFARLYRLAVELYDGDEVAARLWLSKPARALDGQTPLDFADTEAGAHEVENLIGRLEHGVYA